MNAIQVGSDVLIGRLLNLLALTRLFIVSTAYFDFPSLMIIGSLHKRYCSTRFAKSWADVRKKHRALCLQPEEVRLCGHVMDMYVRTMLSRFIEILPFRLLKLMKT